MVNPILSMLNRSASGSVLGTLASVKKMINGGDPMQIANLEMQRNPQFAQFVREHQGKTVEELIRESGLDMETIKSLLG